MVSLFKSCQVYRYSGIWLANVFGKSWQWIKANVSIVWANTCSKLKMTYLQAWEAVPQTLKHCVHPDLSGKRMPSQELDNNTQHISISNCTGIDSGKAVGKVYWQDILWQNEICSLPIVIFGRDSQWIINLRTNDARNICMTKINSTINLKSQV